MDVADQKDFMPIPNTSSVAGKSVSSGCWVGLSLSASGLWQVVFAVARDKVPQTLSRW